MKSEIIDQNQFMICELFNIIYEKYGKSDTLFQAKLDRVKEHTEGFKILGENSNKVIHELTEENYEDEDSVNVQGVEENVQLERKLSANFESPHNMSKDDAIDEVEDGEERSKNDNLSEKDQLYLTGVDNPAHKN